MCLVVLINEILKTFNDYLYDYFGYFDMTRLNVSKLS